MNRDIQNIEDLYWYELIALVIYRSGKCLRNKEIINSSLVQGYLPLTDNKSINQTVSKILNTHSEETVSSDKGRRAPFIFYKDYHKSWCINEEGKKIAENIDKLIQHLKRQDVDI